MKVILATLTLTLANYLMGDSVNYISTCDKNLAPPKKAYIVKNGDVRSVVQCAALCTPPCRSFDFKKENGRVMCITYTDRSLSNCLSSPGFIHMVPVSLFCTL